MQIFKKDKKQKKNPSNKTEKKIYSKSIKKENNVSQNTKIKKKKIRIGFGSPYKKNYIGKKEKINVETTSTNIKNHHSDREITNEKKSKQEETKIIEEDQELPEILSSKTKDIAPPKKKKSFLQKDMTGMPVYLEDTGEKLGVVFSTIYDENKNIVGYKIKDDKSDTVLSFSVDQFEEDKDGLIFVPSWYTKSIKTIEKLEFKERVSPELTTLLADDTISNEELYNIFVKHDDQMAKYIEEAVALKELIHQRLKALEKQRLALKEDLMDLTEKRLIKDIDRKTFSEDVMEHRRKVNILDVNIKKCKELLRRLDNTSFGMLGKHIISNTGIEEGRQYQKIYETFKNFKNDDALDINGPEDSYKQKYYEIKERFEQLEEEHEELKNAVEKLITKSEL